MGLHSGQVTRLPRGRSETTYHPRSHLQTIYQLAQCAGLWTVVVLRGRRQNTRGEPTQIYRFGNLTCEPSCCESTVLTTAPMSQPTHTVSGSSSGICYPTFSSLEFKLDTITFFRQLNWRDSMTSRCQQQLQPNCCHNCKIKKISIMTVNPGWKFSKEQLAS